LPENPNVKLRRREALIAVAFVLLPLVAAWLWAAVWGIRPLPDMSERVLETGRDPIGFPGWVRLAHYANLLLIVLLARSGLQILFDHPRLYWNVHSTPGTEWAWFTPYRELPRDRLWTAKDDARPLSAWIGLPGGRHTVGIARHWHFLCALFWLANGVVFLTLLFASGQWRRLVPGSWAIVPEAWNVFVHYATLHMPPEPDGFYAYNPLQQLAYFGVVFVLAPLSLLTGAAMSPALDGAVPWYPRLFGNRQIARSIHFLLLLAYGGFLVPHVVFVALSGLRQNMNHIVLGTDETGPMGLVLGLVGLAAIVGACAAAHGISWRRPRQLQHVATALVGRAMGLAFDRLVPRAEYRDGEVSPFFWPNGRLPEGPAWDEAAADGFRAYRLEIGGLVENPASLALADIRAMPKEEHTTLHHCIQGWSGIARWGGLPLSALLAHVRPHPEARFAVFRSYGEGLEGGEYYDVHALADLAHPQSLLAYEMNGEPLPLVHGAPLRLRVENQLGYKQIKWIRSIEFVASYSSLGQGEGGYNEDHEFYGFKAEI
jgi:DMSO/TMAO reductase YedYZ molybdopterin-dependent catalytic subunit/thiosulfate reductase cytochrome b subunit